MAWLLRFVKYMKLRKTVKYSKYLTVSELENAKSAVLRGVQSESFNEELKPLEAGKELPQRSKIKILHPFINDGLIYVGGRLERMLQFLKIRIFYFKLVNFNRKKTI